jgi:hypothetical protein
MRSLCSQVQSPDTRPHRRCCGASAQPTVLTAPLLGHMGWTRQNLWPGIPD